MRIGYVLFGMRSSRHPFPGLEWGAPATHSDAPGLEARAASAPLSEATATKRWRPGRLVRLFFSSSSHNVGRLLRVTVLLLISMSTGLRASLRANGCLD